jgi:hypothetical protein
MRRAEMHQQLGRYRHLREGVARTVREGFIGRKGGSGHENRPERAFWRRPRPVSP